MAYERLPQLRALSRRRTEQAGIVLPEMPALNGRLATIDPEGIRAFNSALDRFIRNLAEQLQKLPVDLNAEVLQAITDAVSAAVATAIAGLNVAPVTNVTNVTQVTGSKVTIGVADPNGVVSGNVGDIYHSDPNLPGGTGETWFKCEGAGTTGGWR